MEFEIMSRKEAVRYSKQQHKESSIIISISDSYDFFPNINSTYFNGVKSVLFVSFDDIQEINGKSERFWKKDEGLIFDSLTGVSYKLISKEDAKKIVDFVIAWKDKVDKIIVHCNAGISRSSGVCAAIMKALNGNDKEIFNSHRYLPNTTCYKMVLEEFVERGIYNG